MRIGIDCRLGGIAHAGIGRYIENLVTHLPKQNPEVTWVLFFYDQHQADLLLKGVDPTHLATTEVIIAPVSHYTIREQVVMLHYFYSARLDLLHVPHFNVPLFYWKPLVVTIHDLLWHEQRGLEVTTLPKWMYWLKYLAYKKVVQIAIRNATTIFVPAQTIKKTLLAYYPQVDHKIVVTLEGVSHIFGQTKTTHTTASRELVYVGSLYPHKNIAVVIKALQKLPEYTLTIIGSRSVFQKKVRQLVTQLNVEKQVHFAGFLSDEVLQKKLHTCFALVQPSLSEGFGLTGLEALASGTPVIASDIPIFHEIYKQAPIYFDPHSFASFIDAVRRLESTDRKQLAEKSQKTASQYSWSTMANKTYSAYIKTLASSS